MLSYNYRSLIGSQHGLDMSHPPAFHSIGACRKVTPDGTACEREVRDLAEACPVSADQSVRFVERPDGIRLATRRCEGSGAAGGTTIIFLPGYMSDMAGGKATAVYDWAEREGHDCLLLDYAGCGRSGGDFADQTLDSWRDDVVFLIDTLVDGPVVLVGSSMGGWLMLLVALRLVERIGSDRVAGLVGVAAAPDFTDWGFSEADKETIRAVGRLEQATPYSAEPYVTTRDLWKSGETNRVLGTEIALDCPARFLHGQRDADVPWRLSLDLADRLRSGDVQVVLVKDGDHRLSRTGDIALLLAMLARLVDPIEGPVSP